MGRAPTKTLAQALGHMLVRSQGPSPLPAAQALLQRVLPTSYHHFELQLLDGDTAAMQLDAAGGKVVLRGTGGVELASALNWYMNDYLNATYDWNTYAKGQLPSGELPLPLPTTSAVTHRALPWSYYMNVCTMGYSLVFTDWNYWEKQIVSRTKSCAGNVRWRAVLYSCPKICYP